ncbi:MAG: PIN domain-containing protein [Deltaproteobacteria bacterium]|nr:PIN domain-containing protein [Deltaproteobacteria bacterium]
MIRAVLERFQLIVSEAILAEIGRVLRYPKIIRRHRWSDQRVKLFLEDLAHIATLTPGELKLRVIKEDPSDNRYLECAIEWEAEPQREPRNPELGSRAISRWRSNMDSR